MRTLKAIIRQFARSEHGAMAIEYAAIVALIGMAVLGSLKTLETSRPIALELRHNQSHSPNQPPAPIPAASSAAQPAGPSAVPTVPGLLDLIHCQGT